MSYKRKRIIQREKNKELRAERAKIKEEAKAEEKRAKEALKAASAGLRALRGR
jgi:hypothetical protein